MRSVLSKMEDWWKDREDERLDELVAFDPKNNATDRGAMVYQLVKSARNSRNKP